MANSHEDKTVAKTRADCPFGTLEEFCSEGAAAWKICRTVGGQALVAASRIR
jgi:hypothetical protein